MGDGKAGETPWNAADRRRALVLARLNRRSASGLEKVVGRVGGDGRVRLSYGQQRLWFLNQLEPESDEYHVRLGVRLVGRLDADALGWALGEVVSRHEVLRTRIVVEGGVPVGIVDEQWDGAMRVADVSGEVEEEREERVRTLVEEEGRRPFDLEGGGPMRALLVRVGDEEHVLLVVVHHVAFDGWSLGVFRKELGELYRSRVSGERSPLGELEVQYGDYAEWQRGWLSEEVVGGQLEYWRERLEGMVPLELQLDHVRREGRGRGWGGLEVGSETTAGLRKLSRERGCSMFMTLLTAFQVLLWRYTGQEDVAVGTVVAGRDRPEVEGLIGCFVNTLVMRTDLSGEPSFLEAMERVRDVVLGGLANQQLPFERLVEELRPERQRGRTPLFQVMFTLQNAPGEEFRLKGLRAAPYAAGRQAAHFDLSLLMWEAEGRLKGTLEYDAELLEEATMERLGRHLERLLEEVVEDPGRRLWEYSLLTPDDRRLLLAAGEGFEQA